MRSLIAALLLVVATSAMAADPPFDIDFYYHSFDIGQGGWAQPFLRITGAPSTAYLVNVTWSYSFAVGYPASGSIEVSNKNNDPSFNIYGPITTNYVGKVPGTASISYQPPGSQQTVTKTIPLTLWDHGVNADMDDDRVLESDTSVHSIPFTLAKSSTVPLTVKFTVQGYYTTASPSDYTILNPTITIPPGTRGGELQYTITQDAIPEGDEKLQLVGTVYDGTTDIGYAFTMITITERQVRAMFMPDQLNVFAGDPFSLMVLLSEPMVLPRYSPRTSMTFSTSNPSVVSGLPSPLTVGDSTVVGTMTASAGVPGDAVVTAQDADAGNIIAAAAHVHVYDGAITFGEYKTLTLAPEQSVTIPVEMTPPPPEPIELFAIEDRFAGFVDLDSFVKIDTSGHGSLTIKGKKVGTTIVAIESPGRHRISGIDVAVRNAPVTPPPPPPPSRRRSARH